MLAKKHPGAGTGKNAYNYNYFTNQFAVSETEVRMALREIRYGSPEELETYLNLKYKKH